MTLSLSLLSAVLARPLQLEFSVQTPAPPSAMREAGELPTLPGPGVLCQAAVMTRDDTPVPSAEEVPGAQ